MGVIRIILIGCAAILVILLILMGFCWIIAQKLGASSGSMGFGTNINSSMLICMPMMTILLKLIVNSSLHNSMRLIYLYFLASPAETLHL